MNPDYLWLADAVQILTLFIAGPVIAVAMAYQAWRGKPSSIKNPRNVCVASGVVALLLFAFAKWMNADIRTAQYFLQLACVLLAGLLLGLCMGAGSILLLGLLRWHKNTRLDGAE